MNLWLILVSAINASRYTSVWLKIHLPSSLRVLVVCQNCTKREILEDSRCAWWRKTTGGKITKMTGLSSTHQTKGCAWVDLLLFRQGSECRRVSGPEGSFKGVLVKITCELWGQILSFSVPLWVWATEGIQPFSSRGGTHLEKHLGLPIASCHHHFT